MSITDTESPPEPLPVIEQLLHSTIRIEGIDQNGNTTSSGTGFHYRFPWDGGLEVPTIITNKHVLNGLQTVSLVLTRATSNGERTDAFERLVVTDFAGWIPHPDPAADLALIPIQPLLAQLTFRPFYVDLNPSVIPSEGALNDLSALEDVIMIGYPNGLWDNVRNRPIVRRGITATACNRTYRGKREFLIDAAVFNGSSGSPVFIFNEGGRFLGGNALSLGTRLMLIGIVYAVHLHTAVGTLEVIEAPTAMRQVPVSHLPNNLGLCIASSRISEFEAPLRQLIALRGS